MQRRQTIRHSERQRLLSKRLITPRHDYSCNGSVTPLAPRFFRYAHFPKPSETSRKESPQEKSTETVLNNANRGAPNGTSLYSAARSKHAESLMDDGDSEVGYVNPPKYRRRRMRQTNAPNEWAAADQACSGSAASSASPSASSSSLFRPKSTGEELFSHGSSHGS